MRATHPTCAVAAHAAAASTHAAGRRAAMVASFSLTFFYSEKAYITYNILIFAEEHRCYWFKKPVKKCK